MARKKVAEAVGLNARLTVDQLDRILSPASHGFIAALDRDLRNAIALTSQLDEALQAHSEDEKLTPIGREAADKVAAKAALASLAGWLETHHKPIVAQIAALSAPVSAPPTDPIAQLLREMQAQEIRTATRNLDPVERDLLFLGADDRVRQAMIDSPPMFVRDRPGEPPRLVPFVSPQHVAEWREQTAETADPGRAAALRDLETIRSLYE
nr:hypothetical protein [Acidobacteriota bacterium]